MCTIAPLVRKSAGTELVLQRAQLHHAADLLQSRQTDGAAMQRGPQQVALLVDRSAFFVALVE